MPLHLRCLELLFLSRNNHQDYFRVYFILLLLLLFFFPLAVYISTSSKEALLSTFYYRPDETNLVYKNLSKNTIKKLVCFHLQNATKKQTKNATTSHSNHHHYSKQQRSHKTQNPRCNQSRRLHFWHSHLRTRLHHEGRRLHHALQSLCWKFVYDN
jgi:hypothetical protein